MANHRVTRDAAIGFVLVGLAWITALPGCNHSDECNAARARLHQCLGATGDAIAEELNPNACDGRILCVAECITSESMTCYSLNAGLLGGDEVADTFLDCVRDCPPPE
jgi:hypothetical protein